MKEEIYDYEVIFFIVRIKIDRILSLLYESKNLKLNIWRLGFLFYIYVIIVYKIFGVFIFPFI
jgi:hypothetical protein